jgi:hypothetical protein
MELERRVVGTPAKGSPPRDPPGESAVVADAGVRDDRLGHVVSILAQRESAAGWRFPRMTDCGDGMDDRLLEPTRPRQEQFLPSVLRVVAG